MTVRLKKFGIGAGEPLLGFTEGSVLFVDASGTLAEDNANLFWDDTNNRLGIGVSTVSARLHISQPSDAAALLLDASTTDQIALDIDSEQTTADIIDVFGAELTTGILFDGQADSLTTGQLMQLSSNSSDTSTRTLIELINDNSLATGTTVLELRQDAAQRALFIDQNANGSVIVIDSEATSADIINIDSVLTSGIVLDINQSPGSSSSANIIDVTSSSNDTGRLFLANHNGTGTAFQFNLRTDMQASAFGFYVISTAAQTNSGHSLLRFVHNVSTTTRTLMHILNQGTGIGIFHDQNGNQIALQIDSEATTADVIDITSPQTTTGRVIDINADALTAGKILELTSNSSSTSTRELVTIHNDHTSATSTTPLEVIQDAAIQAVILDQNAASGFIDFQGTASANTTDPISTHGTAGTIQAWVQIEVNGTKRWLPAYSDPSA